MNDANYTITEGWLPTKVLSEDFLRKTGEAMTPDAAALDNRPSPVPVQLCNEVCAVGVARQSRPLRQALAVAPGIYQAARDLDG